MSIPTSIFNQIRTIVSEMKHIRTLEVEMPVCMNTSSLRAIASCISFKGRIEYPCAKLNYNSFECMIFDNYTARLIPKFYKKNTFTVISCWSILAQPVTLLASNHEDPDSNLFQDTDYPNWNNPCRIVFNLLFTIMQSLHGIHSELVASLSSTL
jgi:hypothetical protein